MLARAVHLKHTATVARSSVRAASQLDSILTRNLEEIREAGTYKNERVITSQQSASIRVSGSSGEVLNFCANNYLGLADDPRLVQAAKDVLDKYGVGLASVRFICGTQSIHKDLEESIAKFHDMEDAILFPSCFDANAGLFESVLTKEDAVITDALNHASIIDGIRLCKAQRHIFAHMDMADLEAKLVAAKDARVRMIVTDGVFSMDGDVAPLREICDLADKHDATVFIDECHATGFFGATGKGTDEHCGVRGRVDIINSTLGKALGGASGGYTAASRAVTETLRNKARPYLFSNTVAPPVVGAALKVFELLQSSEDDLVGAIQRNTARFRTRMHDAGFTVMGDPAHPICPVWLGDAKLASEFADRMLARGVYVIGFSFPVVPQGQARIRVQLSAGHTSEQIDEAVDAFVAVGRELKVIE